MRNDKKDRRSFWLFGKSILPVSDFTSDEDTYFFIVYDIEFRTEGGTTMAPVLEAIIEEFDRDQERQKDTLYYEDYLKAQRSLLMITDAMIDDFTKVRGSFAELRERRIIPYVIWIDDAAGGGNISEAQSLLALVESAGGRFFPVSDEDSINQANVEIDKLMGAKIDIQQFSFEVRVFQRFIFMALIFLFFFILLGLIVRVLFTPYP